MDIKQLWIEFGDIPINNNDEIEQPFMDFEIGTDRFQIWHWFDERYPGGVHELIIDCCFLQNTKR